MRQNDGHTVTPWYYESGEVYQDVAGRLLLADRLNQSTFPTERDDNVRFVVQAVNSHYPLIATLEDVARLAQANTVAHITDDARLRRFAEIVRLAQAAIKAAKGG